jgi:hypothetical protein
VAQGVRPSTPRDELRLQSQEVIINDVRAKRAQKKVAFDLNSKLVRIRDIKEAQDQQDAQKAAWDIKHRAAEARKTAQALQNRDMQALMLNLAPSTCRMLLLIEEYVTRERKG